MRVVMFVAKTVVLLFGLMAIVHFVSVKSGYPLLSLSEVQGKSMQPTLEPGERIVCVRIGWQQGDIVLADVGEDDLIVKRVAEYRGQWVYLTGDNEQVSCAYWVSPKQIKSVMLCRLAVPSLHSTRAIAKSPDGT